MKILTQDRTFALHYREKYKITDISLSFSQSQSEQRESLTVSRKTPENDQRVKRFVQHCDCFSVLFCGVTFALRDTISPFPSPSPQDAICWKGAPYPPPDTKPGYNKGNTSQIYRAGK